MKLFSDISKVVDLEELVEIFLFSNTPFFLFKRLKKSRSYTALKGSGFNNDELIEVLESLNIKEASAEEISVCYLVIVFLLADRTFDSKILDRTLSQMHLQWTLDLERIASKETRSQNYYFLKNPKPFVEEEKVFIDSSEQKLLENMSGMNLWKEAENLGSVNSSFEDLNRGDNK